MYGGWILLNLGVVPGIAPFDPTFVILAMAASVEALFLAYHLLGRPTAGLLDHYRWAAEFLAANGLSENPA